MKWIPEAVGIMVLLGGFWRMANLASEQIFATRANTRAIHSITDRIEKMESKWRHQDR